MKVLTPNLATDIEDRLGDPAETTRPFTNFLFQKFGKKALKGAEIGFGFGYNAEYMLKTRNIEHLYCVDP